MRATVQICIFSVFLFFSFPGINAQTICKKLVEWNELITEEFPEIDFYRSGTRHRDEYELMCYNMYSDKYFVPIFGKSIQKGLNMKPWSFNRNQKVMI